MDIMSITSKMLTGLVSKVLTKMIKKQLGTDCDVQINEIRFKTEEGKINLHLDMDASISPLNLQTLLKKYDIL